MCFLVIGVSSILWLNSSCVGADISYVYTSTYHYVNHSGHPIRMMIYNLYESDKLVGDHDIADGDTLSFTDDGSGQWFPFQFTNLKSKSGDSIYLTFANERYLTYSKKQKDAIFVRSGYRWVEVPKRNFVHYWEFTEEDYENAIVIEP